MTQAGYTLSARAKLDADEIDTASRRKWGNETANQYMADLEKGAGYIASNHKGLAKRDHITGETGFGAYPVREHYIIYHPVTDNHIVVVAVMPQERDIPNIIKRNTAEINRILAEFEKHFASGRGFTCRRKRDLP